jgi:hypothetical protein
MKIIYEPHPVTPERKLELRSQGYKIIDERFKPFELKQVIEDAPDVLQAETETKAPSVAVKRRGRPRKAD